MTTTPFPWPNGKRCAVSLSFDDARITQIDRGVPLMDRLGVRGTFYVSFGSMEQRLAAWTQAAATGHEIANHSVVHPCSGNFPWARAKALEDYTLEQMEAELVEANKHIQQVIGVKAETFAFPCGQKFVGRGVDLKSYVPVVAKHFLAGRGFRDEWHNDPGYCDMAQLYGVDSDRTKFDGLKFWIDRAVEQGGWLVFASHEIDASGHQAMSEETLEAICKYCQDPARGVWVDTVAAVAKHVNANRKV